MHVYIYKRIRDLREDADKTQKQVADDLGLWLNTYRNYETGKREFKTKHIKDLCVFYNVSADYILGLPELPYPKR